jgi:hypothetical protein
MKTKTDVKAGFLLIGVAVVIGIGLGGGCKDRCGCH